MQMINKLTLLSFCGVLLAGCAGQRHQPPAPVYDPYGQVESEPVQVHKYEDWSTIPDQQIVEQPVEALPSPDTLRQPVPSQDPSPAVVALLGEAESSSRAGRLDAAAATIERALRIEPRNASLVYKLAEVRMQQGKPRLAEDLGKKANLLSSGDVDMKRKSWLLIAEARRQQGDFQGAAEAETMAGRY